MLGPEIIARSMSALRIPDKFGNSWQYHSQSDRHSKIACWAIMFDLLLSCTILRKHAADGKVGFGVNHRMVDFNTRRAKNLDLVICTPNAGARLEVRDGQNTKRPIETFGDLRKEHEVVLSSEELEVFLGLPSLRIVQAANVCVALEAKAAMTAHVKALPRLHDELDSSHLTIHGHSDHSIAAALVTVNIATAFLSPKRNAFDIRQRGPVVNRHKQPDDAIATIKKVQEIRRRSRPMEQGFDALGIVVIHMQNDGSPCVISTDPPAPGPLDSLNYSAMIDRLSAAYTGKFSSL